MRKEKSYCAYCDEPIGDDWVRGEGLFYCSEECRYAGRVWFWIIMLLIIVPFSVIFWMSLDYNLEILPYLVILLLLIFFIAREVFHGIRARRRISQKRRFQELG
ncbi:MAG: hypothetical protein RTU63_14855 [Candidatus Thorarchaeota archaeon]